MSNRTREERVERLMDAVKHPKSVMLDARGQEQRGRGKGMTPEAMQATVTKGNALITDQQNTHESYGHRIDEPEDPFETMVLGILDDAEERDEDAILTAHRVAAIRREALAAKVIAAAVEWVAAHEAATLGLVGWPDSDLLERYTEACNDLLAVVSQNRAALRTTEEPLR